MKTLDEKAAEYAASVVAAFPELASYRESFSPTLSTLS